MGLNNLWRRFNIGALGNVEYPIIAIIHKSTWPKVVVRDTVSFIAQIELFNHLPYMKPGCPRGVMVKAMNCGIVVREFVLQSRYYVHFRANTLGKGMNPLILPPAMGK